MGSNLHHLLIAGAGGADEKTARAATRIAAHNDVICAHIHDPLEERLPQASGLVMAEEGRQLEVDGRDAGLRRGYESQFAERLEWFRTVTRQRESPLLPISTEWDVASQVRDLLKPVGR